MRDDQDQPMTYAEEGGLSNGDGSACKVRRFAGPEADEVFVVCRPETAAGDGIIGQTESVYRMLHDALRVHGGDSRHVVQETVFLSDIGGDLAAFRQTQEALRQELGGDACRPASTFIEQPPLDENERLELSAFAVIPRNGGATPGRTVWTAAPCVCDTPCSFPTRVVRVGAQEHFYAGSVYGMEGSAFDEAYSMFSAAEQLLQREGLTFQQVVRTWIHLRNIDRDYADLNRARREFFHHAGITVHPASTGIAGSPCPAGRNFSLSLYAVKSPEPLDVGRMQTPTLNEAWMYGADFSRGLRVVEANKVALYVSGTASVDEQGLTAHVGDFSAQVERMLTNISTLLSAQNASFHDVVTAITYLKSPEDAPRLREIFRAHGLDSLPNALVKAAVCRSDLLCEMEAIAALPRPESSHS
jgi:enamine deaminase RidA (YjgF/YER057c/UK114 family)